MDVHYMTQSGIDSLKTNLDQVLLKRKDIAQRIDHARSFGDLKENAEYHAAKEEQALNERKINDLSTKLASARLINESDMPQDQVCIGSTVLVKDTEDDEEEEYTLVSEVEAEPANNKISIGSPVGKGLVGHKKGDVVEIEVPSGTLTFEIMKISR